MCVLRNNGIITTSLSLLFIFINDDVIKNVGEEENQRQKVRIKKIILSCNKFKNYSTFLHTNKLFLSKVSECFINRANCESSSIEVEFIFHILYGVIRKL